MEHVNQLLTIYEFDRRCTIARRLAWNEAAIEAAQARSRVPEVKARWRSAAEATDAAFGRARILSGAERSE